MTADNLSKAGWNWGWVSAIDCNGRTIWIVDAHRGDGRRFIVRGDDMLTTFVELERQVLTVTFLSRIYSSRLGPGELTALLELERITRESLRFQNAEQFGTIHRYERDGLPASPGVRA